MTQHASDCAVHNKPAYPAGPCDCGAAIDSKSRDGITIGLIDALISIATALNERLTREARRMKRANNPIEWEWFSDDVQNALTDLQGNKEVTQLLYPRDERAMDIIHRAASMIKKDQA